MRKLLLVLLILTIVSCHSEKQEADPVQVCMVTPKRTSAIVTKPQGELESMAKMTSDTRYVRLTLGKFTSQEYPNEKAVGDSALHIASVLLSSSDFKTAIAKLDFTCQNYWKYCKTNCKNCSDRFKGSVVLDSVFRKTDVTIDLFLQKCRNEFGHSTRNINEVYSCKDIVFRDERKLSPAYCYAYHLAHEYMHIVGFFHTDHVDDVAEKTGWLGWEILLKWKQAGKDAMKVEPGQL